MADTGPPANLTKIVRAYGVCFAQLDAIERDLNKLWKSTVKRSSYKHTSSLNNHKPTTPNILI
jgi:hypothetical protein